MVNKIKENILYVLDLFKSEDQAVMLATPLETMATFELSYQKIIIGSLILNNGQWTFEYSDQFKVQKQISPIIDFPNIQKVYSSKVLFPFFAARIPSLQRLEIQKIVSKNTPKDEVSLLKKFGKQSIANPYHLISYN